MKINRYKILSIIFVVILVIPTILWPMFWNKKSLSLDENRNLNKFQFQFNKFGNAFENFYNDHFPFRGGFIKMYEKILFGLQENLGIEAPIEVGETVSYRNGWIFYRDEMPYYTGANIVDEAEMKQYGEAMKGVTEFFQSAGKQVVFQIGVNKSEIWGKDKIYNINIFNEYKRLDRLSDYLYKNYPTVRFSYAKPQLLLNKKFYQNYYEFDGHWNKMGGYIAYNELKRLLNLPIYEEQDFNKIETTSIGQYKRENKELIVDYNPPQTTGKNVVCFGDSFLDAQKDYFRKDFNGFKVYQNSQINTHPNSITGANPEPIADIKEAITDSDIIVIEKVERYDYAILNLINRILQIATE